MIQLAAGCLCSFSYPNGLLSFLFTTSKVALDGSTLIVTERHANLCWSTGMNPAEPVPTALATTRAHPTSAYVLRLLPDDDLLQELQR